MVLNLIADRIVRGKIYPALARHQAEPYTQSWREFEQHWPCTVPFRPQEYFEYHNIEVNLLSLDSNWPADAFYPIGLGFFNFEIDYFSLLPERVFTELWHSHIRILFYYHEGDNPERIKQRLDALVAKHQLPKHCYVFVSGNSAASDVEDFVYFADFELWYYQRNRNTAPLTIHNQPRSRDFTALVRLHKPWRAMAMADLYRLRLLDNSYWSYCETVDPAGTDLNDSPIEVDSVKKLRKETGKFLAYTPYESDELNSNDRNNQSITIGKYHVDSYCNIVLETHFDADQSGGTFLTEKTFKPIKHGQMFFIAGPAGSLQTLRDLGYRVFDSILDNSYDLETNNTQRWIRLRDAIAQAQPQLPELFSRALADIRHNQQLFVASKANRLNILLEQINESY
jgi:hypothetical protein